ncbi:hypothetical protein VI817_001670 [Penicillium citrinum]|nr:hypothetical protein VI817_001670 [Penicillium citrinum]
MVDQTMLAPGPAGTSMLGERNIDAAARRGLERQYREQSLREGSAGEDKNDLQYPDYMNSDPSYSDPSRDKSESERHSHSDPVTEGLSENQTFQNESAIGDYSDGPIHSRGTKKDKGGILGRMVRKMKGN